MEKVKTLENKNFLGGKKDSTKIMVKVSLLSAIAFLLMFIEMPIPGLFPSFLKIDISDIPALVAGLTMGPVAGLFVEIVKNFLHFITATTTGGVGEIANAVIGGTFVVVTSLVYAKKKDKNGLVFGFALATVALIIIGSLMNYFVMLPFYGKFMGLDAIIEMGKAVNPKVNDLLSFVLWFIAPFNLIKGVLLSLITLPFYKKFERAVKAGA